MIILAPMSLKFQKKVMPRRKTSKKENESHPTLWELCVSGDVDMVREAVQRGDQVPKNSKHPHVILFINFVP